MCVAGQLFRWSGGQVVNWPGGHVVRWSGGKNVDTLRRLSIFSSFFAIHITT